MVCTNYSFHKIRIILSNIPRSPPLPEAAGAIPMGSMMVQDTEWRLAR